MYTKGKWKVDRNCVYALNDKGTNRFFAGVQHGNTDTGECTPIEELEANARLIAAAPEMYEACKIALEFFTAYDVHNTVISGLSLQLHEVLAEAEGK